LVFGDLSPPSSAELRRAFPLASDSIIEGCDRSQTTKALTGGRWAMI
jgi:hypothetical protein